ncbi:MAG: hypothetical protein VW982_04095 [Candidatus Poseidoniales archaeon]|jgi:hypothetical protein
MSNSVFVKFVSDPTIDRMKSIVGLACAAQAVTDGHKVSVFFAAAGVRFLDAALLADLEAEMGPDSNMIHGFMDTLLGGADLHCSFGSVKAVLGHEEGDGALYVPDDKIAWSGPPGVIALSTASNVQLVY